MHRRRSLVLAPMACTFIALTADAVLAQRIDYPHARVENVTDQIHGVSIADPYRWLEDSDAAEVAKWTDRQNALTRFFLDPFTTERAALTSRLKQLYSAPSVSTPRIVDNRYFYTRREGDQNQPVVYVKVGSYGAAPHVAIDPNEFSAAGTIALDWWFPAPDGRLIAYGRSAGGSEKSTLYIRDVDAGKDLELAIPHTRASSVAWDADSRGFHYIRYPIPGTVPAGDENYYRRVHYHKLGTDWKQDPQFFGEGRPKEEWVGINNSVDNRFQFMFRSLDWMKNDLFIRRNGESEFRPIAVGLQGRFAGATLGDKLFITTDYEAPRQRVLVTDANNPAPENWKELIPQQAGVIQSLTVVGGKLVLSLIEDAHSRLMIYNTDGTLDRAVKLPKIGSVTGVNGHPDRPELYFGFDSFAYPPAVMRYHVAQRRFEVVEKTSLRIDFGRFVTKQIWFTSQDGTRLPMSIVHGEDLKFNRRNPTILYGYGGFGANLLPSFSNSLIPWLERGGVYALVHLRGGGEFGAEWHAAGRLGQKQNVFDDMIAAAEKLIAEGYTDPEHLAARGRSNGGLLMGAMMVQRPDLFKAIHCAVPLLDMLRYHNFSIARLWIPEYGSAENADQFKWLYEYSPYHHVEPGVHYPAILFTTAESDSRVAPMHARKMAARMQAATASSNPILLWVETQAGHGAGKPVSKRIESAVDYLIFFMWQLGMIDADA
ncbi:MAG: S9 family peptidase [Planctomycetes bacterium]|nr:S9 family peptidase [Planctomycetota bacterium]